MLFNAELNVQCADCGLSISVSPSAEHILWQPPLCRPRALPGPELWWPRSRYVDPGSGSLQDGHWDPDFHRRGLLGALAADTERALPCPLVCVF